MMEPIQGLKEFEVTVTVRNNLLKQRREMLGLSTIELAAKIGVSYGAYIELETMRASPVGQKGWRPVALQIAAFWGCEIHELFPDAVLAVDTPSATRKLGAADMAKLTAGAEPELLPSDVLSSTELRDSIRRALRHLEPREAEVLCRRHGLNDGGEGETQAEVGARYGITAGRVGQIEASALRKLRRRPLGGNLRAAMHGSDD